MFNFLLVTRKLGILISVFIFINFLLFSQKSVGVFNLEVKNVEKQTSVAINNAIFNFINELKDYTVFDMRNSEIEYDKVINKFDYVFIGELTGLKNAIKLKLILKQSKTDVTRTIYKIYRNSNLILLDSRVLVSGLFDKSVNLETAFNLVQKTINEEINSDSIEGFIKVKNLSLLSGSWYSKGEFERIEIMRGGRAIAVLPSGVSIFLQLKLNDGYLNIKQLSAPLAGQFINLPDEIAKKFVNYGKTPSWKFLISNDNKTLSGEKFDTEVNYSDNEIISTKEITRQISWTRN